MASPIPPDPYAILGVSKDADLVTIRSAHRKLALKCHPDRIKDEALRDKGKDEFQKVQEAYELLSDPVQRSRYDDKVKLAELRKEAMMRGESGPPPRPTAYPMRPAPPPQHPIPTTAREYREESRAFFEERVPTGASASYFNSRDTFEDTPVRASSRKYPEYERRTSTTKTTEKEKKVPSSFAATAATLHAAMRFKEKEKAARLAKQKEKEREARDRERDKEARDKEKRRGRSDRFQARSTYMDDSDSDSGHDRIPRVSPTSTTRSSKPSSRSKPATDPYRHPSSRPERSRDFEDDSYEDEKWERHHRESKEYMAKAAKRPGFERSESGKDQFWTGDSRGSGRKSGSDNDRRPMSSRGHPGYDDHPPPPPPMPTYTSAPANLNAHVNVEEREPHPSRRRMASGTIPRDHERDRDRERDGEFRKPTEFKRAQTLPPLRSTSKRDTAAPSKSASLKHREPHDSGYGSSPSPRTPDMREESPPRSTRPKQVKKYQIVDPESEDESRRPRVRILDDEDDDGGNNHHNRRYFRSPEAERREPDYRREKPERPSVDTTSRARYEQRSPRDTLPTSRHKTSPDLSSDERESPRYSRPYETVHIAHNDISSAKYANYWPKDSAERDYDYGRGLRLAEELRHPNTGRRPRVY